MRDDGDARFAASALDLRLHKGQWHTIDVIDQAETIRPFDDHAVLTGNAGDLDLFGAAFLTPFGETRRKDDDAADAAKGD